MQSRNIPYLPSVDALRGIAALWILMFHAHHMLGSMLREGLPFNKYKMWEYSLNPLLVPLLEGHTAVALFMTLSGFIFTWGSYGKQVQFLPFITNRLLRIYPLYLVLLFVGLAAYPQAFNLTSLLGMIFPLADFVRMDVGGLTAMSWAIGVEFQFYLLFPMLFLVASKSPKSTILWWIVASIMLRLLAVALGGNARDISYWHLSGRLDQFLLGMLAAFCLKQTQMHTKNLHRMTVYGTIASIALLFAYHILGGWPADAWWKVLWPTIEGLMWAIVIAGLVGYQHSVNYQPKTFQNTLAWLGERSFSIYLLHYPIIKLVSMHPTWLIRFTGHWRYDALMNCVLLIMPTVLLLSQITWHAIEKPFLGMRKAYL